MSSRYDIVLEKASSSTQRKPHNANSSSSLNKSLKDNTKMQNVKSKRKRRKRNGIQNNAALSSLANLTHRYDSIKLSSDSEECDPESNIKDKKREYNTTIPSLQFNNSTSMHANHAIDLSVVSDDVLAMQSLFIANVAPLSSKPVNSSTAVGAPACKNIKEKAVPDLGCDIPSSISVPKVTSNPLESSIKNELSKHTSAKLNSHTIATNSEVPAVNNSLNEYSVLTKDLFMQKIAPLYAVTSTRSLENLRNHPQFHHIMKTEQQSNHLHNKSSLNSGTPQSTQYMQNLLQHPLFCQTISQTPLTKVESPKKRKKKNKHDKANEQYSFEDYWTPEEVEDGLNKKKLTMGALRINSKQYQCAYISIDDRSEQDIFINGMKDRNRALEGDIVVVELLEDNEVTENVEEPIQKKGKVIYIKEYVHSRTCIGNLKLMPDKDRQRALFIPRDHRMPRLHIPFTSWPDNFYKESIKYENTLFLAKIIDWWDSRFALAAIVCNIGQAGDLKVETQAILAENDLNIKPFGPEVQTFFPKIDYIIPNDEILKREDCRSLCIFSIDPFNCRDIDDAVSCRVLSNGNFEVGVHISDVSHYLAEDTILDAQVAEKATTIYLVDKAYHMLPDELCTLCSLLPGADKLAFSIFWEITPEAEVINHRFAKTVINSCAQLAYEHAQGVLEDQVNMETDFPEIYGNWKYDDICRTIKNIGSLSAILRKKRFEGGALRIDQTKVTFSLDPIHGIPLSFKVYLNNESHQLIEEFMLLANMTVAKQLFEEYPSLAFLRCHPPPSMFMLKDLAKSLKPLGININIKSAGDLQTSLHKELSDSSAGKSMVLNLLCAKSMTRAMYFCADGWDDDCFQHYALNVPLYTHFTSPIRRYADIIVHRLLAASINFTPCPKVSVEQVKKVASNCNKQKYNAKKASEMSTELYTFKYIELNSPVVTEGVVVEVRERYIDVIVLCMALNRRIYFNSDFPADFKCIKNNASNKLSKIEIVWPATPDLAETVQVIEVFSVLKIQLEKGKDFTKIETKLVRPIE